MKRFKRGHWVRGGGARYGFIGLWVIVYKINLELEPVLGLALPLSSFDLFLPHQSHQPTRVHGLV